MKLETPWRRTSNLRTKPPRSPSNHSSVIGPTTQQSPRKLLLKIHNNCFPESNDLTERSWIQPHECATLLPDRTPPLRDLLREFPYTGGLAGSAQLRSLVRVAWLAPVPAVRVPTVQSCDSLPRALGGNKHCLALIRLPSAAAQELLRPVPAPSIDFRDSRKAV